MLVKCLHSAKTALESVAITGKLEGKFLNTAAPLQSHIDFFTQSIDQCLTQQIGADQSTHIMNEAILLLVAAGKEAKSVGMFIGVEVPFAQIIADMIAIFPDTP